MKKAEKEPSSPTDYFIQSLEYAIKALRQYQVNKEREQELNKPQPGPIDEG